jgi:hypothetical protein
VVHVAPACVASGEGSDHIGPFPAFLQEAVYIAFIFVTIQKFMLHLVCLILITKYCFLIMPIHDSKL